jgi:hypothetical protein
MNITVLDITSQSYILSHTCRGTQCSLSLLEMCAPTPNFVRFPISVYDTLKLATKLGLFFMARRSSGPGPPYCPGFAIILRHITLGRTPLDE